MIPLTLNGQNRQNHRGKKVDYQMPESGEGRMRNNC